MRRNEAKPRVRSLVWDYRPASRARDYRKRAHDCIVTALSAVDANACADLLDVAAGWTRMAQQLEKLDPDPAAPGLLEGVRVLIIAPKSKH